MVGDRWQTNLELEPSLCSKSAKLDLFGRCQCDRVDAPVAKLPVELGEHWGTTPTRSQLPPFCSIETELLHRRRGEQISGNVLRLHSGLPADRAVLADRSRHKLCREHRSALLLIFLPRLHLPFGSDLPEHFPSLTATLLLVSNLRALFRWQIPATLLPTARDRLAFGFQSRQPSRASRPHPR